MCTVYHCTPKSVTALWHELALLGSSIVFACTLKSVFHFGVSQHSEFSYRGLEVPCTLKSVTPLEARSRVSMLSFAVHSTLKSATFELRNHHNSKRVSRTSQVSRQFEVMPESVVMAYGKPTGWPGSSTRDGTGTFEVIVTL